jgi:hypothetical protein
MLFGGEIMRFWSQKKWKKMLFSILLIVLVVGVALVGYLEYSVYREITATTEILDGSGAKTALVIYHPGLTDFAHNVTYTYADALASNGWRVEIATASPKAPTNITNYSLLVLCWPIYDFNPAPTITTQIHRIGNLNGIDTVVIAIGGGIDPFHAPNAMNKIIQDANGTILQSLVSFRSQHNQGILREEASKITP